MYQFHILFFILDSCVIPFLKILNEYRSHVVWILGSVETCLHWLTQSHFEAVFPWTGMLTATMLSTQSQKHWLPGLLQELWSRHISRVIWAFNWIHGQWSYCWKFGNTALPVTTLQAQWPLSQLLISAYVAKAAIDTLWTSRVALSNKTCYTHNWLWAEFGLAVVCQPLQILTVQRRTPTIGTGAFPGAP